MNAPPEEAVRVPIEPLRAFLIELFTNQTFAGSMPAETTVPPAHAERIADLLIDTDLRGVVSHGVMQVERYVRSWQKGTCNPSPTVEILKEGPATAALNGDGGLGYLVATQAMEMAIERARDIGVGIVTTTHHDHIGSAGKYVRMALRQGQIGVGLSGRSASPSYDRDNTIIGSIQGSPPFCIGMPSGLDQPPFMLDMSTAMPWDEEVFAKMPQVYLKAIGISHVANILSGTLGGQMLDRFDRDQIEFSGANQSGFFMALAVDRFVDPTAFRSDMDHLVSEVSQLQPLPGFDRAELPGGPEWRHEAECHATGIPLHPTAQGQLEGLAQEFGVVVPW